MTKNYLEGDVLENVDIHESLGGRIKKDDKMSTKMSRCLFVAMRNLRNLANIWKSEIIK